MKVAIIEDEETASGRLKKILADLDSRVEVVCVIESIERAVPWFKSNPAPDLIFADIQLADGPSFEIFRQTEIVCPVIFTTAFDSYALDAFKFNGIDYILKPIKRSDIEASLKKYSSLRGANHAALIDYREILSSLTSMKSAFQKRIVVRIGQTIRTVEISDVAYFYTEEKIAFACMRDAKRLPLDFTLDELEKILDPSEFFRINRQFIIHIRAIENMYSYPKSRIKVVLKPHSETETVVSAERSPAFREWLLGKG
ncbi:MAG TPA: LytTR family DNA-binding domain-containing protein [Chryseosolibacter sp.]|nr:LytTR family DNA-binding domain-containing protein [Chryseosolibacter sp.]